MMGINLSCQLMVCHKLSVICGEEEKAIGGMENKWVCFLELQVMVILMD